MNESIDLRKRILKMREINNTGLNTFDTFNYKKKDRKLIDLQKEKKIDSSDKELENASIVKAKSERYNNIKAPNLVSENKKDGFNSYDAQFRLLANKFNEAVEVILELSKSVENLEKVIYVKNKNKEKVYQTVNTYQLKVIVFIVISLLFLCGLIYLPINFSMFKVILNDILSLI